MVSLFGEHTRTLRLLGVWFLLVYCCSATQRIVEGPTATTAVNGSRAVFTCRVAEQNGSVQWKQEGFALGADRGLKIYPRYRMIGSIAEGEWNLEINPVTMDDEGSYQCQIGQTATQKYVSSKRVNFVVLVKPTRAVLSSQGDRGAVLGPVEGKEVQLNCASRRGKPPANLTWMILDERAVKNVAYHISEVSPAEHATCQMDLINSALRYSASDPLECNTTKRLTNNKIATTTNKIYDAESQLSFKAASKLDGQFVVCVARHAAFKIGFSYAAVQLNLEYKPRVNVSKNDGDRLRPGRSVSWECSVEAKPAAGAIRWLRDGRPIADATGTKYMIAHLSENDDNAVISCEARNKHGVEKADYVLLLERAPKIATKVQTDLHFNVGDTAVLECEVDSNPPSSVLWSVRRPDVNSVWRPAGKGNRLTLKSVSPEDDGIYRCEAELDGFESDELEQRLKVRRPPVVWMPTAVKTQLGSEAPIVCEFVSFPKRRKNVLWYKNGEPLPDDDSASSKYKSRIMERDEDGEAESVILTVMKVDNADLAEYKCVVENSQGSSWRKTRLILDETPVPLYVIVPIVVGVGVVIFVFCLSLCFLRCCRNRCRSKSSQNGDIHSDVAVKVEPMDGQTYPEMYSTAPIENGDPFYNGKDYVALPQVDVDCMSGPQPAFYHRQSPYQSARVAGGYPNGHPQQPAPLYIEYPSEAERAYGYGSFINGLPPPTSSTSWSNTRPHHPLQQQQHVDESLLASPVSDPTCFLPQAHLLARRPSPADSDANVVVVNGAGLPYGAVRNSSLADERSSPHRPASRGSTHV